MTAPTLTRCVAEAATCPAWCDGTCVDWSDSNGTHHISDPATVTVDSLDRPNVKLIVSVGQIDPTDGPSEAHVHLITGGEDYPLPPAQARTTAALLLNAADLADPLPAGVTQILAEEIRVGDEIDTPDGWQIVYMTTVDARARFVAAFTDQRDDSDTDGWQYTFGDPLTVRRAVAR